MAESVASSEGYKVAVTVIILTHNEELHLARAIASVRPFATDVVVVDSFSTDGTPVIAKSEGARFFQRSFKHQADQFNWALAQTGVWTDWVMRLDADEVVHDDLGAEILDLVSSATDDIAGAVLQRRHIWMGNWVRYGGRYPLKLVRLWRTGRGHIEDRWMDEHAVVTGGRLVTLKGGFSDWCLRDITFFTDKHNRYATREAIQVLGSRYRLFDRRPDEVSGVGSRQAVLKRLLKDKVFNKLPYWLSAALYFIWRYIFQLGFLDGRTGLIYHFLQGFWYRFLVGAKVVEFDMIIRMLPSREARIRKLEDLTGHVLSGSKLHESR